MWRALTGRPDGKNIAFRTLAHPLADDWTKADIAEVEVATGRLTELAKTSAAESAPHYSPDGRFPLRLRKNIPEAGADWQERFTDRHFESGERRRPAVARDV